MKIETGIVGVLAFLGYASGDLAQKWKIDDPDPTLSGTTAIDFVYGTSGDTDVTLDYKIFKNDAAECDTPMQAFNSGSFTDERSDSANTGLTFQGDAATADSPKVTVTFVPAGLTAALSPDFYSEAQAANSEGVGGLGTRATIEFCIRFSLYSSTTEVNFQESVIKIFIDLTDGFDIATVEVAPKDRLIRTSTAGYQVVGTLCSTTPDSGFYSQGSVICVNVTPETVAITAGLVMRSVDSFIFTSDAATQAAISGNAAVDLLTTFGACDGQGSCQFSTILKADFYTPVDPAAGSTRTVSGSGVATMKFGSRRLGEDSRELQEEDGAGASEFDINFDINPAAPIDESSALTAAYGMVVALLGLSMIM